MARHFTVEEANELLATVRPLDGEEILLCWQLGEDEIAWWHSLEGGFAGRRPL